MPPSRPRSPRPGPLVLLFAAALAGIAVTPALAAGGGAVPPGGMLRAVTETRGSGTHQRFVARVDVLAPDGTRRRLPTVLETGLEPRPSLAPDGRSVAFVRADGRIAVVSVRDGRVRLLTPPDLPKRSRTGDGWTGGTGTATVRWAPSGTAFVVGRLLVRSSSGPLPGAPTTRAVACTLRPARCSTAGPGAPADLLPLAAGRMLRLDGPVTGRTDDGRGTTSGFDAAEQRSILQRARRRVVVTAASVVRADGRARVVRSVSGTGRTGVVSLESEAFPGGAGVLVRRARTRVGPDRSGFADGPSVAVSSRNLRPWLVTPGGRVTTFGRRLGVDPVGTLPDGRWIMPTGDVSPSRNGDGPEPELATLDGRGRVRALPVAGRPVTPVRLALEAGLPDAFAVGAHFDAVVVRGGDLVVTLSYSGADGLFFFPADRAVVRIPRDGSAAARTVDHESGASYAVR